MGSNPLTRANLKGAVMSVCKHCKEEFINPAKGFMASHTRWCIENPKREEYILATADRILEMNAARKKSGITNHFSKAKLEGKEIPSNWRKGTTGTPGTPHTEETKKILREKALASPHRRLRRKMIEYKGVMLDSTWELALAVRLDELDIDWIRPDPIPWTDDNGIVHNYFGDFFLPKYNLILDPKNPQAIRVQSKKLKCLLEQYGNIIILDSIEKCKQFRV